MPYMNMPLVMQTRLEEGGVRIVRKPFDFRTKTDLSVQLPDGRTLDYYNYMHQIPDTLYNGEEISLGEQAIPAGESIYVNQSGECTDANCGTIWDGDNPAATLDGRSLVIPPLVLGLIVFVAKVLAVFIAIYFLMSKWLHPCGPVSYQTDIDQCIKVITYPDCSTITIDSCNVDEQGNPDPEVINRSGPPGMDLIQLIIIGGVIIAGIIIAPKIIDIYKESRKKNRRSEKP